MVVKFFFLFRQNILSRTVCVQWLSSDRAKILVDISWKRSPRGARQVIGSNRTSAALNCAAKKATERFDKLHRMVVLSNLSLLTKFDEE